MPFCSVDGNNGDVKIEFPLNTAFQTSVESITMRQVAKYRHQGKADSSLLSVAMKYTLKEGISPILGDRNQLKIGENRTFVTPDGSTNSALPHQYLEASITSPPCLRKMSSSRPVTRLLGMWTFSKAKVFSKI
jgi:hypothetical protein